MGRALAITGLLGFFALVTAGCGSDESQPSESSSPPSERPAKEQTPSHHYEGGEKSIERFGAEAQGSSRGKILATFHNYLNAIAAEDFGEACTYLTKMVRQSMTQLAGQGRQASCSQLLSKLLAPSAPAISRQQVAGEIKKVRVEGDQAFVVFHAPGAKLFQMTLSREGGRWKVTTVVTSVLVPEL